MQFEFHPYADLFPLIEGDDFAALVADVRANGIHQQIDIYQGKILDGRNRYRAAEAAGIEIERRDIRHFMPDLHGDPLDYVMSQNLRRRHMDESQRAMVAARYANMRQGERTDLPQEPSANLPKVDQQTAAKALSISERALRSAKRVQERGVPELIKAVDRGRLAVSLAERAARMPVEQQRRIAAEAEAGRANVVRTVVKQESRAIKERELGERQVAAPEGKFGVILEDFEWDYEPRSRETGMDRHAANHYETASDAHTPEEIVERTRERFACAADDCVLFMCATNPHLAIAMKVLELRGFKYVSNYALLKDRIITGWWNRGKHEILLIGTKGKPPCPAPGTQWDSVIPVPVGEHSAKGEIIQEMIEQYYPTMPKIELNRRGPARPGWKAWGNEAEPAADPPPSLDPERTEQDLQSDGEQPQTDDAGECDVNADAHARVTDDPIVDHSAPLDSIEPAEQSAEEPATDHQAQPSPALSSIEDADLDIPDFLRRAP